MSKVTCVVCGNEFEKRSNNVKTCSVECRKKNTQEYMQRFWKRPDRKEKELQRSRRRLAVRLAAKPIVMEICVVCGKEFKKRDRRNMACSTECSKIRWNPHRKIEPIAPFPDGIDREAFGSWLSGFADGEGCFRFPHRNNLHLQQPQGTFVITVRQDDAGVLRLIQAFWGCGTVKLYENKRDKTPNAKPIAVYHVSRIADLTQNVIPHFERYPLMAKKRTDYHVWKRGVELLSEVQGRPKRPRPQKSGFYPEWTATERENFWSISEELRHQRRYVALVARDNDLMPFPENIDRDHFGHWLSGFTDAEGSFMLRSTISKDNGKPCTHAAFRITLRDDDSAVLYLIRSFFGCGTIGFRNNNHPQVPNANPVASYSVQSASDLARIIIPHFERCPLRAKKRNDFAIWKKGVELVSRVARRRGRGIYPKWTESERERFLSLSAELKDQRQYGNGTVSRSVVPDRNPVTQQLLFNLCD